MNRNQILLAVSLMTSVLAACPYTTHAQQGFNHLPPEFTENLVSKEAAKIHHKELFEGKYGLPKKEEVESITGEVYEATAFGGELPTFRVPNEYYGRILQFFDGASIDLLPFLDLPEVGTLVIRTKDKRLRRICWYSGAQSPVMFSLHGVRCIARHDKLDSEGIGPVHFKFSDGELQQLLEDASRSARIKKESE